MPHIRCVSDIHDERQRVRAEFFFTFCFVRRLARCVLLYCCALFCQFLRCISFRIFFRICLHFSFSFSHLSFCCSFPLLSLRTKTENKNLLWYSKSIDASFRFHIRRIHTHTHCSAPHRLITNNYIFFSCEIHYSLSGHTTAFSFFFFSFIAIMHGTSMSFEISLDWELFTVSMRPEQAYTQQSSTAHKIHFKYFVWRERKNQSIVSVWRTAVY